MSSSVISRLTRSSGGSSTGIGLSRPCRCTSQRCGWSPPTRSWCLIDNMGRRYRLPGRGSGNELAAHRLGDGGGAVGHAELVVQALEMGLDRRAAEVEL